MMIFQCNCTRCRRMSGTVSVGAMYANSEVKITGTPKKYTCNGGSGMLVHNHFCPECGARVYTMPEAMGITLGAFDDSLQFEPRAEIFANYKMKWLNDNGCIKESFEEGAVAERIQLLMENLEQRG